LVTTDGKFIAISHQIPEIVPIFRSQRKQSVAKTAKYGISDALLSSRRIAEERVIQCHYLFVVEY